jgi:hypothetical protein
MEHINCKTTDSTVVIEDSTIIDETIEHEFAEATEELVYLGPNDVCPKNIAEIATDFSGKPVK